MDIMMMMIMMMMTFIIIAFILFCNTRTFFWNRSLKTVTSEL